MAIEGIDPYSPPIQPQVNPEPPVEEEANPEEAGETVQDEDMGNNIDTTA
jgi:hypothetical protein